MSYRLIFTKQAQRDAKKIKGSSLAGKVKELLQIVQGNPLQNPPPFEALRGDLSGAYSRRINIQHRLVYQVLEAENVVKVLRMWSHYD